MRISLWGFYQYDPTLFDSVLLPDGIEKDYVVDEIMKHSGDLYPYNQQPAFLKKNIANWFNRNYAQLERMINALLEEYSPIENYDRYEDLKFTPGVKRTETHSGKDTEAHSGTDKHYESGTDTEAHSGTDGRNIKSYPTATRTTENKVSAFDSSTYAPHDQQTVTGSGYDESQDDLTHGESVGTTYGHHLDLTHGESVDTTHGHKITNEVEGYDKNDNHIHGNIGVTTAMSMINEELELRKFDIYLDIARRFEKEFLIQIY